MSIKTIHQEARRWLKEAGIENPEYEARLILKHVTGMNDADFITGAGEVSAAQMQEVNAILKRRVFHEPLTRILGNREFRGLPFRVTPDVLDPRPDTETLVDAALKSFETSPASILDLGTGSGCILVALLHEWKEARGTGVDLSAAALEVAAENAAMNGVSDRIRLVRGNWGDGLEESFDLIVSNPPYIRSADIPNLDIEVRNHDPILALDGGEDGLDAYKIIIGEVKKLLAPGGVCFLEIGIGQGPDVARLAADSGLSVNESFYDLGGVERVIKISSGDSGEN